MSEVPHEVEHEEFRDASSESDDNVSLSDPESDTDAGESGSEEDFVATDRLAEEVYKEPQPDSDTDSAHAAHHDQEVEAYMERSRSQAVPERLPRLPSLPDLPQARFARAGEVVDDNEAEPAASEQETEISVADNGHSTSADANTGFEASDSAEQHTETFVADNEHSTSGDASTDTESADFEQQTENSVPGNGHSTSVDDNSAATNAESISGQEQPAQVPALTAETQQDAVLPSIEAVSEVSDAPSVPEAEPDSESVHEAEPDSESVPEAEPGSESVPEAEPDTESVPEAEPDTESVPEAASKPLPPLPEAVSRLLREADSESSLAAEPESELSSDPESEALPEPESESLPEPESEALPEPEYEAAQPSEAADSDGGADRVDANMDANNMPGQQPAATRADFAEIQKLLGQATSQGPDTTTESHDQEAESASSSVSEDDAAESAPVEDAAESASVEDADAEPSPPTEGEHAESGEIEIDAQADNLLEPVHTVAASASGATASSASERPSAGGLPRLPSLPVRRGTPSLPSRTATSAGASSAPTVTDQQRAEPAPAAPAAGDAAPAPAKPTAPVAGNGHAEAAAASNAGTGTSSSTTVANASTSSSTTAAKPPVSTSTPSKPSGSAAPSIPPRPAGTATPPTLARAPGSANPSIPPRQPAASTPSSAVQPASNGRAGPPAAAAVADDESAENRELREKVQNFRVLLVQLTMRLGQSTRGSIVQQVNYRLDLAERIRIPQTNSNARRPYGFETAVRTAEAQEAAQPGQPLPFACTVMVIGMTGVGKSATINSVLDEDEAAPTNAFQPATKGIREITGTVAGVRVKFIDTPGLQPSAANIGSNQRLLNQMHAAFKKHKPDIMLYMDRADIFRTDMADVPLLRAITDTFGPNMWFNTIVALTHAAAAPPDSNTGPLSYDSYTRSRTQLLQQNIRQASGDMRLLNPVALVENHPACRKNEKGWGILPNQLVWKPHLILLLLSSKLLSETDSLLKLQQHAGAGAGNNQQAQALRMLLGGAGRKMPPIPYLISNFIQKKSPRKPPDEERTFKHNCELKDLNVMDRKEEMRRRREYSRMRSDEAKAEAGAVQAGVPAPDIPLQPTFDADNNSHRYRYMEPPPDAALCRPVMDPNGFDHDDGMNAFTVEKSTVIRKKGVYVGGAPAYLMSQVHKERDLFNVVSEAEASYYHSNKLITTASLDGQTVQSDVLYSGRLETRFKNHPKNKTGAGLLVSRLKEDGGLPTKGPVVYGAKIMDRFKPTDKVKVILASATVMNKPQGGIPKEQAWNHSAETRIKSGDDDKLLVTAGLNNMRYRGKSGYGGNVSTQYAATPGTTVMGNLQLNNDKAGKMTMRVSSHDYPKLGFSLLVPTVAYIWARIRGQD